MSEGSAIQDIYCLRVMVRIQDPSLVLKKDVERFLWNFMALRTSSGPAVGADGTTNILNQQLNISQLLTYAEG